MKQRLKQKLKKVYIYFLYYSGINWMRGKFMGRHIFCVGYHSISDDTNKELFSQRLYKNISVSIEQFENELRTMQKNGHTFIHLIDLHKPETFLLKKPTVIFFDDGFKDVLLNALPVLQKLSIPATIFITTGLVDRTHFLWTLGLRHFLYSQGQGELEIEKSIALYKKMPMVAREQGLAALYRQNNFMLDPHAFNVFLNWDDVRVLSGNNFEIGSHSIQHQKLIELTKEELAKELEDSKKILEEKINKHIETISYPHGRYNQSIIDAVHTAGYRFGLSTESGVNTKNDILISPYTLKKVAPEEGDSSVDFKVRLYSNFH